MKIDQILTKLSELEGRVANIKDWKGKYEAGKTLWEQEKDKLQKELRTVSALRDALYRFLNLSVLNPQSSLLPKETIHINHKELIVNLTHQEKTLNLSTSTVMGKVLFIACKESHKEGFTEADISNSLKEHGWNVGHSTLAPTLGGLVKDGYFIRLEGKPAKYRLPIKIRVNFEQ